ncbi:MAG: polyprenyl synthetase family protein [Clostridia bacterium]|nr:polyprenyl synthetase family protein [Clostridia bacterium]
MIPAFIEKNAAAVDARLSRIYPEGSRTYKVLYDAQKYSLLAGGKRIRPVLVMETCAMLDGDARIALDYAAAVEMVHTYSLIHDDLPCMDDDDLRRGRPTNHKVFGEDIAILAGDGLLTDAFGVILSCPYASAQSKADAALALSRGAGSFGMVKGQVIDMYGESHALTKDELLELHRGKTGALIEAAVRLGCYAAGLSEQDARLEALVAYARNIGLAFQVIDDILDCTQSAEMLGKSVGSDQRDGKTTFMSFYDVESARAYAKQLTSDAISSVIALENSQNLVALAEFLVQRNY